MLNNSHPLSAETMTVSNNVGVTILNIDVQQVSSAVGGLVLFISNEQLYNYVEVEKSKVDSDIKEKHFYTIALSNLIKRNNSFILEDRLERGVISKRTYNRELKENPSKYIIDTFYVKDHNDIGIIHKIVSTLPFEFSVDDVAEMFSMEINSFSEALSKCLIP